MPTSDPASTQLGSGDDQLNPRHRTTGDGARLPGRPRTEEVETAILDAAIDELVQCGHKGLTIEGVAVRAGVAKTTIYRRWPGKDELVFDALSKAKGPVPRTPTGSVRDCLIEVLGWMSQSWLDSRHGQVMRRLASDGSEHPELYSAYRNRLVAPRMVPLHDILRRGVDEGIVRAGTDVEDVVFLLTSPVIAAAMTHRQQPTATQLEFIIDTVLAGLAP